MEDNLGTGSRIRNIRKKLGLTMEEFGKLFDPEASKGVVSNWENNYNFPNNERLKKIADLGNMSVNELLYGTEYVQLDIKSVSKELASALKLIKKYQTLSDDTKKLLEHHQNDLQASEKYMTSFIEASDNYIERVNLNVKSIAKIIARDIKLSVLNEQTAIIDEILKGIDQQTSDADDTQRNDGKN